MKKRLLSAFLAVMMVLTMAPVAFAADEDAENTADGSASAGTGSSEVTSAVAKIGDTDYATLQAAVNAANNGDTIVLKKSISATEIGEKKQLQFVKADMNVTLDLNQNTITAEAGEAIAINAANITLTVKNGTIENFAEGSYSDGVYAYKESNNLTLTFENIVLKSRTQGLAVQGLTSNSNVNIVNSNIISTDGLGIYYPPKSGTLTISDSEIAGVTGIVVKGSNLVVKGEKTIISGTGPNVDPETYYTGATDGSSTLTETGDAVYVESGYNDRDISVSISGGHLNSKNAKAVRMFVKNGENTSAKREISVTGGTFSSDVSAYVAEGYVQNNGTVERLGETNAVAKVGDTYYKTLSAAVAVAKDGDTVTLLKNVVLNSTLTLNKNMILDLNGCEISNGSAMGTNYLVSVAANADVSIVGDKANSKISDSRSNAQGTITAVVVYGKLTVEGDNLTISRGANGIAVKVEDNPGTLIVNGGTITVDKPTQTSSQAIQNWGNATINGGVFNGDVDSYTYIANNQNYVGNMTIKNGTFNGEVFAAQLQYDNQWPTASARVAITGGNFKGIIAEYYHDSTKGLQPVENVSKPANTAESEVTVSGGYFTVDPSAYCVTGKTGVSNGDSTYPWTVGEKIADTKPAEVADATVAATVDKNASDAAKDAAKDIGGATMAQNEAIKAAAKNEANKNTIDADTPVDGKTVTQKLQEVDSTITSNDVKIVYQTYIDVEVKDAAKENNTFTELTVELTPMYRVIAAKSGVTDYHVDVDKNTSSVNAVQIVGEQPLTLTGKYEVTLHLPNDFVVPSDNKLSIKHQKSSGVEYYTGTVDTTSAAKMVTFETNGFSPFTISAVAAYVGTTAYPSLQEAANAANNGATIVVKNGASHDLTFNTTKSVKVKNDTGVAITVKFNGTDKGVAKDATETFSYTKPSSGGSSGGSSSGKTTYKVTTSAVNNGGVNASPSNAEKGATITITLSPDKGYKLDKLTVTDGSGKTVSTVKKSDTVYTFTMPASAVKVGVSYVKATETPSKTKFNDVSANDWFASAVDYVTGKGMMNGTADNTFSPKANTTRGMVVTVLYRLENQPSTSAASFTDVASGAYYANAVAWANANGIVSGYGSGKFGPNDKVTREQLAAILYRYAQYKKYDVSVGEDTNILSYDDAQSISSYAIPAIQWACGAGVVTGKSGSKLDPKGNATRAEVAAMLMRFCENVK
ncbi:S-layer homology domain-containing protein [Agathobaculum sp.]|uniref:S-layer homology domain-containing protein n=1 Tax=Agathobaculum sp. TaxID=2048138 RepID=UPI003AB3DD33